MTLNEIKEDNIFGRFFYSQTYITLKNFLFNYLLRKRMVEKYSRPYYKNAIKSKNSLVIDIGSGISPITPVPEKTLFIDIEKEAIEFLRKNKFSAQEGDINNLKIKKNSADLIYCSEVLEHLPDYNSALKELSRILKPKGHIIITVPTHDYYWKDDDEFVGHFRRFNPDNLKKDIQRSGLEVLQIKPIGNWLERNLSWLAIRIAKPNISAMSNNKKLGIIKKTSFRIVNLVLFYLVLASYFLNSVKRASVILFVATKN